MRKLLSVGRKEVRQILRDRRTLATLLLVPAFFLLIYGYALSWDLRHVRLAVLDRDRSAASRSLIAAFTNSGYFDLFADVTGEAAVSRLMDEDSIRLALVIPPGLERDVLAGRVVPVQVILNGDNANTATTVMGYALSIIQTESSRYQMQASVANGAPIAAGAMVAAAPRIWYNPQLRSTLFLVPGLIAFIMMITAVVSTALSIVREKERGTMEQIRMAPLRPDAFVIGKTLPYFAISLISAFVVVFVAMALFGMPMRGSWLLLSFTMSLFLVGALGFGLLISSIAETQQVAFQIALLTSFLPTLLLSGFIFPISSMPPFLQLVTHVVPARYFLVALRGIVLKGVGWPAIWEQLAALAAYSAIVLLMASVRLRRAWH